MQVNGLPLHPLVVHATVVFTPMMAAMAMAYGLVGRWRAWLRWPMVAVSLVAAGALVTAFLSGRSLRNQLLAQGLHNPWIAIHQHRATILLVLGLVLAALVVTAGAWLHPRVGSTSTLLVRSSSVVLVGLGLAVAISTYLTGDAGARALWGR